MSSHLEERLREAAALGDLQEVQALLRLGVEVNAQNEINGWTCLHWACKRNHTQVVAYLLDSGADKEIFTDTGELAVQLTSKKEIRKILGDEIEDSKEVNDLKLPAPSTPLTNVPFPCTYNQERNSLQDTSALPQDAYIPISPLSRGEPSPCRPAILPNETELPGEDRREGELASPTSTGASEHVKPQVQNCPVSSSPVCLNRALFTPAASRQHVPHQAQPLLLTGTFPYNMQELVLKVRVQNPNENDFIEIELDRQELTYQDLLRVSCSELGVNPEQVEKIRKLPNTLVRKDKDVARLLDFQELELVLVRNISSFRSAASTPLERPCYNTTAAKLTY
ncbi:ankyrin repeat domain-containing protein 40-like [Hemicordylus capensis]|uniref:ankyrin repeat domain-containing protein 40-like n=1 Tax=Hemicordylus capensis TaxID=884348 RepID=UPI002303024D|nr:ankyrin repeat domain-containing protein 40-like [Hemicordylus capensis]XP_053157761.1 ankyrin repeat domain-containing protein 40-like [Hemicordylus capensis]